jgi:hypothetical protein
MKPLLLLILFSHTLIGQSQSGKITVRKNELNLVGKTLQLNDLRGAKAGTINFNAKNTATAQLEIEIKNPIIKTNFNDLVPQKELLNCSYSIINDTLLVLTHKNYTDTCYYKYINESTNVVQLKNTLHGIVIEEDFAICFHLDSILYSQTYNKSISDTKFNQNIEFDSIYKNVRDKKLKKELEEKLNKEIKEYTNSISYNYYKGKYSIKKNKLKLFEDGVNFVNINLLKNDSSYKIKSDYLLDGYKPLTSQYTHNNYGDIHLIYGKAFLRYLSPGISKNITTRDIIKTEIFNVRHINEYSLLLFNETDTLNLWRNNNFTNVRINNSLGGFYQTHYKALNGNTIPYKKILFTAKEAIEVNSDYSIIPGTKWNYKITDSALYLFNQYDTLIDELSNSWESFSFTYHNSEPFIFGTYHYKTTLGKHIFLILFENNTGTKFSSNTFDYKEAREILKNNQKNTNYQNFTFSASKDFLWINFEDGKYQKRSFFNYNKAIREETKEQTINYYLIE